MPFRTVSGTRKRVSALKNFSDKEVERFIAIFNNLEKNGTPEAEAIPQALGAAREDVEKQTGASTPAPKKDQISGSSKNKKGSASTGGGKITISESTETSLKNKVKDHNDSSSKKVTLGQLKAVYRRGAGAFSTSHRPGMTRAQWAMARVNSFLKRVKGSGGHPQDDDLIKASEYFFEYDIDKATTKDVTRDEAGNLVYRGNKYPGYNKPMKDSGGKQGKVLAKKGDQIKVVRFGDPSLRDNYSNEANDAYYARHGTESDKFSAKYWSNNWLWPRGALKGKGPKEFHTLKKSTEDMQLPIIKAKDDELKQAIDVIYEPFVPDAHGQWMSKETIRKACDNFNTNLEKGHIKDNLYHSKDDDGSVIECDRVETLKTWINECDCYIGDQFIPEGTWLGKFQYHDDGLWEMKKSGVLQGVSIGGRGRVITPEDRE